MDTRRRPSRDDRRSTGDRGPAAASSHDVEVVDLGPPAPAPGIASGRGALVALVGTLAILVAVVGLSGEGLQPTASQVVAASPPTSLPGVIFAGTPVPATPFPWAWTEKEIFGYGRGSSVANLWVLDDVFVAEIEADEGPDGGPAGPMTSVLLGSTDGLSWSDDMIDLPVAGFSVEGGAVAEGRLWLVGATGGAEAPRWQSWSTDGAGWRLEESTVGLVGERDRLQALAFHVCPTDPACPAAGWVAVVAADGAEREELRISGDGRSWMPLDVLGVDRRVIGLTFYGNAWYMAALRAGGAATEVFVSSDRVEWSSTIIATGAQAGRAMASGVGGLVVVGEEAVQGDHRPRVWLSGTGQGWLPLSGYLLPDRAPAAMDLVTATSHGYFAMNAFTGDAWLSSGGELWWNRPAFAAETGRSVGALVSAGDYLVAAGSSHGRPTFWSTGVVFQLNSP